MSSLAQPAPDRDVYQELLRLTRLAGETNAQVAELKAEVAAMRGDFERHTRRVDDHLQRLYAQDKQLAAECAACYQEGTAEHQKLRELVQTSARAGRSLKDKLSGGWFVAMIVGSLLMFLSNLAVAYYSGAHRLVR